MQSQKKYVKEEIFLLKTLEVQTKLLIKLTSAFLL